MEKLTHSEINRYHRHLILPQVDETGQEKLKHAKVLIVGVGGLGSPIAMYLTAAGIGHVGLMDDDVVSTSNLQRQVIHSENMVNQLKVDSAAHRLSCLNPFTHIETYPTRFCDDTAHIAVKYDIVIDATDNFTARYAINRACVEYKKPMVFGAVFNFDGQVSVFAPHQSGPCYECVFPNPPEDTGEAVGVFGVLPGIIGSMQAAETLKLILGIGKPLLGKLMAFNALDNEWYSVEIPHNTACPVCGNIQK